MRRILLLVLLFSTLNSKAQSEFGLNERLPIVLTIQFHAMTVPFHNFKANFKNIGIGIGTELNFSKASKFHQSFSVLWYRNQALGNGLLVNTQIVWRPSIGNTGYGELRLGPGYLFSKRPIKSYQYQNGDWITVGKKGKGLFNVLAGVAGGYRNTVGNYEYSPFAAYQIMAVGAYNRTVPLVTETLFQIGTRLKKQ